MTNLFRFRIRVVPLVGLLLLIILFTPVPVESGRVPCPQGGGGALNGLLNFILPSVMACPILDLAYIAVGTTDKLMVMNVDQINKAAIYSQVGCRLTNPSWAPDGKAVAFRRLCNVSPYPDTLWRIDVSVVNGVPKGSNARQLSAACANCFDPAWSPTGEVIAVGGGGGTGSPPKQIPSIFLVDANTGVVQTLYTGVAGSVVLYSSWSSDGQRLAVTERDPSGVDSIKILDRAGNVLRTLVPGVFNHITHIDWARQGVEKLAITEASCATAIRCIYTVDFASPSETVTKIVDGNAPAWSPDNARLAFGGIQILELATGKITSLHSGGDFPDWRRF